MIHSSSIRYIPLLLAVLCLLLSSCGPQSMESELDSWVGENVRIQFRRDALGAGADLPISPATSNFNGADTVLVGKLVEVHAASLVIEEMGYLKWIPREVILLVQGPLPEEA